MHVVTFHCLQSMIFASFWKYVWRVESAKQKTYLVWQICWTNTKNIKIKTIYLLNLQQNVHVITHLEFDYVSWMQLL